MAEYMDIYSGQIFKTDYIPREAVRCKIYHNQEPLTEYQLNSIPAADVVERKTGYWIGGELIPNNKNGHYCAECSECHKIRIVDNYCSNCIHWWCFNYRTYY